MVDHLFKLSNEQLKSGYYTEYAVEYVMCNYANWKCTVHLRELGVPGANLKFEQFNVLGSVWHWDLDRMCYIMDCAKYLRIGSVIALSHAQKKFIEYIF